MASSGSGPSYPVATSPDVARGKAIYDRQTAETNSHHRPKTEKENYIEGGLYQPSMAEAKWLAKAKIAAPVGQQAGGGTTAEAAASPAGGRTQAATAEWAPPADYEELHKKSAERVKAMLASKRDEDASKEKYAQGLMLKELAPISVGDLMNNFAKGAKFTDDLGKWQRDRPDDPIVKRAVADTQQKFAKLFDAVRKLASAAIEFVQGVQEAAGRYQAIDVGTLDSFNANMREAANRYHNAHEALNSANFGGAWAEMVLGVTSLNNAGADAAMLNLKAMADAQQMESLLRFVQAECKLVLSFLGGAGTGLARLLGVVIGATVKGAELYSAKEIYHTATELTVSSIAADTLLDLAGLWMGENFTGFISNKARKAVEDVVGASPPAFKDKVMKELQNLLFGHTKAVLSKGASQYLGEHGNETKTGEEMGKEILYDTWSDYIAEKLGALVRDAVANAKK